MKTEIPKELLIDDEKSIQESKFENLRALFANTFQNEEYADFLIDILQQTTDSNSTTIVDRNITTGDLKGIFDAKWSESLKQGAGFQDPLTFDSTSAPSPEILKFGQTCIFEYFKEYNKSLYKAKGYKVLESGEQPQKRKNNFRKYKKIYNYSTKA